jgi:hypothetical protein
MLRLIKANRALPGKPHLRNGTPWCFLNFRALDALLHEGSHFTFQIVAHEIEPVDAILIRRVDAASAGGSARGPARHDPASTDFESEDVAEKCAAASALLL